MPIIETTTTFYLGNQFDLATGQPTAEMVYYDSRDLTTHAVMIGMTGSGKTGLSISLLEEAILDRIPAFIIDPKGDMANLLLSFPGFTPQEFAPWINADDAARAGMDIPTYAAQVAKKWFEGITGWGMTPERVQAFKNSGEFTIYTPGSNSGIPISVMDSLQPPRQGWLGNETQNRERISSLVSGLLALTGKRVVPFQDREHVLISTIIENAWMHGFGLTLPDLIMHIHHPPFATLGVLDLNAVFPEKDRLDLAREINEIIASPTFQYWLQGQSLDVNTMLFTPDGRPRVNIFYLAHLNDEERAFFITLLLQELASWMQTQAGTGSLRAMLYFDEVFGFFPPHPFNPPTKEPLLRLLKEGRAFGLGVVLATQNPVDLDYKGLSNAGTWFIGRLQTENDKNRLMDGLQSAVTAEHPLDMKQVDQMLSALPQRVFLVHNIHGVPVLLNSRWAMSYLAGPMTRTQIEMLMQTQRQQLAPQPPAYQTMPPPPPTLPELGGGGGMAAPLPVVNEPLPMPVVETPPPPLETSTPLPVAPLPIAPLPVAPVPTESAPLVTPPGATMPLPPGYVAALPALPPVLRQYFLPTNIPLEQALYRLKRPDEPALKTTNQFILLYEPFLLAQMQVRFREPKMNVDWTDVYSYQIYNLQPTDLVQWEQHRTVPILPETLSGTPFPNAAFGLLPAGLLDERKLNELKEEIERHVYRSAAIGVMSVNGLNLHSLPGETAEQYQARLLTTAREQRDAAIDQLAVQYQSRFADMEDRYRLLMRRLQVDMEDKENAGRETIINVGEMGLDLLRGRIVGSLSRMSRLQNYRKRSGENVVTDEMELATLYQDMDELQGRFNAEVARLNEHWSNIVASQTQVKLTPFKDDTFLDLFGVAFKPNYYIWLDNQYVMLPAWQERYQPRAAATS